MAHPLIIFDSDDFLYTSFSRNAIPLLNNWNPSRVLPEILEPFISFIGAYVIYPIMGDYIMSLALVYGILLSALISIYFYFIYKFLIKKTGVDAKEAKILILLFIFLHFLIYRTQNSNNEHIFSSNNVNCIFFYTIPTLLNIILVLYFELNDKQFELKNIYRSAILILLIYLAIFSNLFSSYILGIWSGINLIYALKKFNKESIKKNKLYIGILALWFISMIFELSGGRSSEVNNTLTFSSILNGFLTYINKYLSLNKLVLLLMLISLILFIYMFIKKQVSFNEEILTLVLMFVLSNVYLILLSSKCGQAYFRADTFMGVMIMVLFGTLLMISVIIKNNEKGFILIPLLTLICFFNINTSERTFRDSNYLGNSSLAYKFDSYVLNKFNEANTDNETKINIEYPIEWENWPIYGGYPYSNTFLKHRLTSQYIDCYMVGIDDFDISNYD